MTSIDASSFWPLRLIPGDDLRRALEEAVHARGLSAAFVVAGIGSLRQTRLEAGLLAHHRGYRRRCGTAAPSGTISEQGSHMHPAVADA